MKFVISLPLKLNRPLSPYHTKSEIALVARRRPTGMDGASGSRSKLHQGSRQVIHRNRCGSAAGRCRSLGVEAPRSCGNTGYSAHQCAGNVKDVRTKIGNGSPTRNAAVKPPGER